VKTLPPPPAGRPGGRGLGSWIKTHKGPAAAIGGAGAVGLVLLYEHGKTAPPGTAGRAPANPAAFRGQTDSSYGALQAQIAALQAQISKLTQGQRHHKKPHAFPIHKAPPPKHRKPPPRSHKPPPTWRGRKMRGKPPRGPGGW